MGVRSSKSKNLYKGLDVYKSGDLSKTITDELPVFASGGTVITSGNERYHVFLQPGEFKTGVGFARTADIIIVAGGGGGGSPYYGGGGGAGGVVYGPAIQLGVGTNTYSVTVGAGGYARDYTPNVTYTPGGDGGSSGFGTVFANGGGGGGSYSGVQYQEGGIGGSAGGPSYYITTTQVKQASRVPASYTHYGNNSGAGQDSGGGGGGGSGTAGGPPGRKGGDGRAFPQFPGPVISPTIPESVRVGWANTVGSLGYYGGGGGGCAYPTGNGGGGGLGGGGNGSPYPSSIAATPGINFTGGGGGGSSDPTNAAGTGGSGIVIIKYLI